MSFDSLPKLVFFTAFFAHPRLRNRSVRVVGGIRDAAGYLPAAFPVHHANPAYDPNAPVPQTGMGKKRRKENKFRKAVKGHLRDAAKVGHIAALGATVAGQPELAVPADAAAATLDILGSGVVSDTRAKEDKKSKRIRQISEFGDTLRGLGAINKQRRKKVPRYTIKAAKKNSSS